MAKDYSRTQRVADMMQRELAKLIQNEMKFLILDFYYINVFISIVIVSNGENRCEKDWLLLLETIHYKPIQGIRGFDMIIHIIYYIIYI